MAERQEQSNVIRRMEHPGRNVQAGQESQISNFRNCLPCSSESVIQNALCIWPLGMCKEKTLYSMSRQTYQREREHLKGGEIWVRPRVQRNDKLDVEVTTRTQHLEIHKSDGRWGSG